MRRVFKTRHADQHLHVVARELRLGHVDFGLDHVLHAEGEVGHRDAFLHAIVHAVNRLVVVAGKMQHGFAHGLGRDGAGIDAGAADHFAAFHHGNLLAQFRAIDGGALAGGAGADDDKVVDNAHKRLEGLPRSWMRVKVRFGQVTGLPECL